ncbi:hypothetical protein HYQ46_007918, partial [Verticillium longisporum]
MSPFDLLLATDPAKQLLPVAVARQADARCAGLPLDARPAFPALEVELFNTNLLLERSFLVDKVVLLLGLVVTAVILGATTTDHLDSNAGNEDEPGKDEALQQQKGYKEVPGDLLAEADHALRVPERLEEIARGLRHRKGTLEIAIGALVADLADDVGNIS